MHYAGPTQLHLVIVWPYLLDLNRLNRRRMRNWWLITSTAVYRVPRYFFMAHTMVEIFSTGRPTQFARRIYMCLMVSNCYGERSFSTMALIKNKLRSTMTTRSLTALELLSVESDVLDTVSFMDIVEKFATDKSRKRFYLAYPCHLWPSWITLTCFDYRPNNYFSY